MQEKGRAALARLLSEGEPLRPSRPNAPEIWRCRWQDRAVLLKSYHHCPAAFRHSVGRWAMAREWGALVRLCGTGCAPAPLARPLPWTVVMELIEGRPLETLAAGQVEPVPLLEQVEALLARLAERGVVHGDLGHDCWSVRGRESNLILTPQGRLVAIDFAGSWRLDGRGLQRSLGLAMQRHDALLLTKVLYHFGDESVRDHPGWRLPSQRSLGWWELMRLLGKV
jgi:hypothetical protein